ncbi:multicopper oxidase family protein [Denitrobaculum tricleocarpae]|uniref:Multicopper oxidase family protein n=1 Tax=Denitrobaculum tricleocarpae TaxID=2591009 RepID=A0A545SSY8_9PROT|nr:multicopper oxidase family protein [Denitrobaculum tricleocarpae]TQV68067.1 multicopper oxidase family protein [Denitrobaculum tricleocarpae]
MFTRREFVAAGLAGAGAVGSGIALAEGLTGQGARASDRPADVVLKPQQINHPVLSGITTKGMMSYAPAGPAPVLRMKQGEAFAADLINGLDEATTIHWHGLRIPNAVDGVPFLTQPYVYKGERFRYAFTPPDAGTFWYHPHCNTLEQMGRGLTGLLIIEEPEDPGFDQDLALNLRDFRLGDDGQFIRQFKPRLAARGGTLGTVMTANWRVEPRYEVSSGGLLRLRLAATDVTRVYRISVIEEDTQAAADVRVIALDANPVPVPFPLEVYPIGAGQRMDLAIRLPREEGKILRIETQSGAGPRVLATLITRGPDLGRSFAELKPLPPNPVLEPDLANATTLPFTFSWSAEKSGMESICGTLGYSFWAINRVPWPGDVPDPGGPLAELKQGQSYIFRLINETPNSHPIHLHGMSFKLLRSNKRKLMPLVSDTALLLPNEHMEVALVADNPGDWVFHCHVIEHQKSGLTGYVRVV